MKPVRIGCAGWSYPHWRDPVYAGAPQSRWLSTYAEEFGTVEVNSTFYRLPSEKGATTWNEQTPDGFMFSVKASRYLTHVKRLKGIARGIPRFYAPLKQLDKAGKLGPTLWQLPETFQRDDEVLANALSKLPARRHCFEFRHASWFVSEVYELLRDHGVALVVGDDPERKFQTHELTADWTYVRFHRGTRGRGGNYSRAELEGWAKRIAGWRRQVEVFAYFNNDWDALAVSNARLLRSLLD
jgi:uncharacterized protein YecE (DUF72 family)